MTRRPGGLQVGKILGQTFKVYRAQFIRLIPAVLVVSLPVAIIIGLIRDSSENPAVFVPIGVIGGIATALIGGMAVEAAKGMLDGRRDQTFGGLLRAPLPVLGPLVVAGSIVALVTQVGLVLLIVPGLLLATIWAVFVPAIVVERTGAIDALARSQSLVTGHGWRVPAVVVVIVVLGMVGSLFFGWPLFGSGSDLGGYAVADMISRTLIDPLAGIAAAVMYFQLRELKDEGQLVGEGQPVGEGQSGAAAGQPDGAPAGSASRGWEILATVLVVLWALGVAVLGFAIANQPGEGAAVGFFGLALGVAAAALAATGRRWVGLGLATAALGCYLLALAEGLSHLR